MGAWPDNHQQRGRRGPGRPFPTDGRHNRTQRRGKLQQFRESAPGEQKSITTSMNTGKRPAPAPDSTSSGSWIRRPPSCCRGNPSSGSGNNASSGSAWIWLSASDSGNASSSASQTRGPAPGTMAYVHSQWLTISISDESKRWAWNYRAHPLPFTKGTGHVVAR